MKLWCFTVTSCPAAITAAISLQSSKWGLSNRPFLMLCQSECIHHGIFFKSKICLFTISWPISLLFYVLSQYIILHWPCIKHQLLNRIRFNFKTTFKIPYSYFNKTHHPLTKGTQAYITTIHATNNKHFSRVFKKIKLLFFKKLCRITGKLSFKNAFPNTILKPEIYVLTFQRQL